MKFSTPIMATMFCALALSNCSNKNSTESARTDIERYPGAWSNNVSTDFGNIAITLGKNNIRGCGDFYYKQYFKNSSEFLVACTRTEGVWKYYQVWPKVNSVTGPIDVDKTVSAPR